MSSKYGLLFLILPLQAFAHSEELKGEDNTAFLLLRQPPSPARPTTTAVVHQEEASPHVSTATSVGLGGIVVLVLLISILWRLRR